MCDYEICRLLSFICNLIYSIAQSLRGDAFFVLVIGLFAYHYTRKGGLDNLKESWIKQLREKSAELISDLMYLRDLVEQKKKLLKNRLSDGFSEKAQFDATLKEIAVKVSDVWKAKLYISFLFKNEESKLKLIDTYFASIISKISDEKEEVNDQIVELCNSLAEEVKKILHEEWNGIQKSYSGAKPWVAIFIASICYLLIHFVYVYTSQFHIYVK